MNQNHKKKNVCFLEMDLSLFGKNPVDYVYIVHQV